MRCDDGCQFLLVPVPRSLDLGVHISYEEDLYFIWLARQVLLHLLQRRLVVGWYIRNKDIPEIPPCHNRKTQLVWAVVCHPLYHLPPLPPLNNGDPVPMVDLRLLFSYGVDGAMPCVDPLYYIRLL